MPFAMAPPLPLKALRHLGEDGEALRRLERRFRAELKPRGIIADQKCARAENPIARRLLPILGVKSRCFDSEQACTAVEGFCEFERVDAQRLRRVSPKQGERCLPFAMALGVEHANSLMVTMRSWRRGRCETFESPD